jgi:hypothetical protein
MCRALSGRRSVSHWKERPQRMRRSIIVSPRKMPCFAFIFDLHEGLSGMFCYFFCTRTKAPMATVCLLLGAFGSAEDLSGRSQKANDGEWPNTISVLDQMGSLQWRNLGCRNFPPKIPRATAISARFSTRKCTERARMSVPHTFVAQRSTGLTVRPMIP